MNKNIAAFAALPLILAGCSTVVKVETAEELVEAIAPDRVIELAPGQYDLTKLPRRDTRHVTWRQKVKSHWCLVIHDVTNLRIRGPGEGGKEGRGKVRIVASPDYADVLTFEKAVGLTLANLEIGHTGGGAQCYGAPVRIRDGDLVVIEDCILFGCGAEGLSLDRVANLVFRRSVIRDCSAGIVTADNSARLRFEKSAFRQNAGYNGFAIRNCRRVVFDGCEVTGNRYDSPLDGVGYLFKLEWSSDVTVRNCRFEANRVKQMVHSEGSTVKLPKELTGQKGD